MMKLQQLICLTTSKYLYGSPYNFNLLHSKLVTLGHSGVCLSRNATSLPTLRDNERARVGLSIVMRPINWGGGGAMTVLLDGKLV